MQRSSSKMVCQIVRNRSSIRPSRWQPPCDVFISHRGIDTKKNVAGLLHDHLSRLNYRPFLDSMNMKPGDKLFDKIDMAIRNCQIGISVLSPRYCDSYFCLHELSLLRECNKRVIPIFVDVKPSELHVKGNGSCTNKDFQKFSCALEEIQYTVGLAFNSSNGDWAEFLKRASDAIVKNLLEVEEENRHPVMTHEDVNNIDLTK